MDAPDAQPVEALERARPETQAKSEEAAMSAECVAPIDEQAKAFMGVLTTGLPADERMILCAMPGDPTAAERRGWRPVPWHPDRSLNSADRQRRGLDFDHNAYVSVASMYVCLDGTWRRRADNFAAGRALMVDDVGTKVPPTALGGARDPTGIVETSPGNYQLWFVFAEPMRDREAFGALIDAFVDAKLLGADPGMKGVTRVGRIPGFVNGKAKYLIDGQPFRTRLVHLDPARLWMPDELTAALGLTVRRVAPPRRAALPSSEQFEENVRAFKVFLEYMRDLGLLKRTEADRGGWIEVQCPWIDEHTHRADSGAAVAIPSVENGWYGGFRCHHGHCANRGWSDLTEKLSAAAAESIPDGTDER